MRPKVCMLVCILVVLCGVSTTGTFGQESKPMAAGMVTVRMADLKWAPHPALPPGTMVAVLREDPATKAIDLLVKANKDWHIAKHWHSPNERVSVIEGTFTTGSEGKKSVLTKGGFMYLPGKTPHEAWMKAKTIILVSGEGSFDVHYVNPADEPASYKEMMKKAQGAEMKK